MKKINLNKIVYIDKQNFQELPTIPIYQKATANDFNQIKNIVNSTIDELNLNVSSELESLNNSTVKITSNQVIDGIKTFINSGGAITFNSKNQSQYLEFKNDNVSISFFGKLNESNNDISIVSNSGKLIFSATQGCFFESPISGIQNPINDDSPTNKIYVDTKDSQLNSLILNLENLLNSLANDFNKLRPFNFKGKYDPNTTYSKNDAVDNPKGYLFISVIDDNLNNSLDDEDSWISAGPQIDLTNYYSKIEIDQKLNLKSNKDEVVDLTSTQTISGGKTFSNKITLNKNLDLSISGNNALFIEWIKDGTRLAFLGKGSSSKNDITFSVENNLIITASNINFNNNRIQKIADPTAIDDGATKNYVDNLISTKADKTEIDTINVELSVNSENISENSANILLKADKIELDLKQNKLTAGDGIEITDDIISSTIGTDIVDLTSNQTITGFKTFNNNAKIDGTNYLYFGNDKRYIRSFGAGLEFVTIDNEPIKFYIRGTISYEFDGAGLNVYNKKITNLSAPTSNGDAANKKYVDDELLKTNTSITNLAKSVDILVGEYTVAWASKTTNTSAGTNLKTLFGDELWSEILLPSNKMKYILKCYTTSVASGNDYALPIDCINQIGAGRQKITLFGAYNINAMQFNNPASRTAINATLMINDVGDVRFYVLFGTALNSNFSITNIKLYRRQITV